MSRKIILLSNTLNFVEDIFINISTKWKVDAILSEKIKKANLNIPVFDIAEINNYDLAEYFFIIADNENMVDFMRILHRFNLKFIDDYVPHWLATTWGVDPFIIFQYVNRDTSRFNLAIKAIKKYRKIMVLFGNCQTVAIQYYLQYNKEFSEKYCILSMPYMWLPESVQKYEWLFKNEIFKEIDILVTQNISVNNKFGSIFATQNVLKKLSSDCKIVKICNCYSDCYYPQFLNKFEINEKYIKINENGLAIFKNQIDYNVVKMITSKKSIEEILDIISDNSFYSKKELFTFFWDELEKNIEREKDCDVKICDYLESHLMTEILFEGNNHPSEKVLMEITRRLLKVLEIDNIEIYAEGGIHAWGIPGEDRTPIYPSVINQLGIQDDFNLLYRLPTGKKVSFREYMKSYISTIFDLKSEDVQ